VAVGEQVWAIVLAAGSGKRFGPGAKQFREVGGVRMVDRTLAVCRRTCDRVALVLPRDHTWNGPQVDALAVGGDHQAESLRSALAVLPDQASIAVVADPAHPLAGDGLFSAVIDAVCRGADGAVPTVPIHDIIQRVADGRVTGTVPKAGLMITQSPHAFRVPVLRAAHAHRPRPPENASLLVDLGYNVVAVPGDPTNLHVTTPAELAIADRIADQPSTQVR
jgi:2-C-methyl-D-erythritol 4-phosphate cytidylyltransferase